MGGKPTNEARDRAARSGCAADGRSAGQVAPSRASRWRAAVLVAVHLLFALHMAHWMRTGETMGLLEPSEAMEFSKHSIVNAGLIFFALLILSSLVLGRFFCGWACHLVALQDLCRWLMLKVGITPRPLRSRALALVPFGAAFYMFLWPLVYRWWVDDPLAVRATELSVQDVWRTMPGLTVGVVSLLVCGFGTVYLLGAKGFCTYACPYGAFFGVADRVAPGRIRVTDACEGCGHCTRTCSSNVDVAREVRDHGMVVDPGCMKCLDCVSVCPKDALYFGFGRPALGHAPRREDARKKPARLPWADEFVLGGAFLAAFFTFRGLYDLVPFLFALGWASILAFLVLRAVQVLRRPSVRIADVDLVTQGRRTRAGTAFLGGMAVVLALWAHSAWVRVLDRRSVEASAPLLGLRDAWFTGAHGEPDEATRARAEAALAAADRALDVGLLPKAERHVEAGWAALLLGDVERFRAEMRAAQARNGVVAAPSIWLASEAANAGDLPGAGDWLRRATRADPDDVDTWNSLVQVLLARQLPGEALAEARRGVELRPRNAGLRALLAWAHLQNGQGAEALAAQARAVELAPDEPAHRERLARLLAEAGRGDEAVEVLRAAPDRAVHQGALMRLEAELLRAFGHPEEAAALAREVVGRWPELAPWGAQLDPSLGVGNGMDAGNDG